MAVPLMVQQIMTNSSTSFSETTAYKVGLPNLTLSANCNFIFFGWATASGTPTLTVNDDKAQGNWTLVVNDFDSVKTYNLACYIFPNTAAGVEYISVNISGGGVSNFIAWAGEIDNVATTSPQDVTAVHTHSTATTVWSPGAMTTVTNGDILLVAATDSNGAFPANTKFASAGAFTLDVGELRFGMAGQHQVQGTAGAITLANMAITSPINTTFIAIGIALKSAAAGTAPTRDPRIVKRQWCDFKDSGGVLTNVIQQFIPTANNIVLRWIGAMSTGLQTRTLSSVSDGTNTYTRSTGVGSGTAGFCQSARSLGSTPGNYLVTVTPNAADNISSFVLDDVQFTNAQFDKASGTTGNQTTAGDLSVGAITPSRSGGILMDCTGINAGTIYNPATAGWLGQNYSSNENGGGNQYHQDNGWSEFYPSNVNAQTPDYHNSQPVGGVLNWANETLSLVPPAAGGGLFRPPTLTGLGAGGPFFSNPVTYHRTPVISLIDYRREKEAKRWRTRRAA